MCALEFFMKNRVLCYRLVNEEEEDLLEKRAALDKEIKLVEKEMESTIDDKK